MSDITFRAFLREAFDEDDKELFVVLMKAFFVFADEHVKEKHDSSYENIRVKPMLRYLKYDDEKNCITLDMEKPSGSRYTRENEMRYAWKEIKDALNFFIRQNNPVFINEWSLMKLTLYHPNALWGQNGCKQMIDAVKFLDTTQNVEPDEIWGFNLLFLYARRAARRVIKTKRFWLLDSLENTENGNSGSSNDDSSNRMTVAGKGTPSQKRPTQESNTAGKKRSFSASLEEHDARSVMRGAKAVEKQPIPPPSKEPDASSVSRCVFCLFALATVAPLSCGHRFVCKSCEPHYDLLYCEEKQCEQSRLNCRAKAGEKRPVSSSLEEPDICARCKSSVDLVAPLSCGHRFLCKTCLPKTVIRYCRKEGCSNTSWI